ncbi:hypothetical protein PSFL6913_22735 [Pseudomonas fluorescens]|nr:hypothetical protein ALQ35_05741 [Pseudomonas fluorescens]
MQLQPGHHQLGRQQLQQIPRPPRLDVPQHLRTQAYRHTHSRSRPDQQQVDQHLAGDFPHQFVHFLRRQHSHPTDHRRHINEQQRLIAEYQQAVGNRVVAELQQFIKFGLGDVLQQFLAVGLDVRQQVKQLRDVVPQPVKRFAHATEKRRFQHPAPIQRSSVRVVFPLRLERAVPLAAQARLQRPDHRLIRRVQRLDVICGNVGIEADSVRLVAVAVGDFENAAGADGLVDWLAQRPAVGIDTLQHHRRVADRHKPRALEHVHQGQRAVGLAGSNSAAGKNGAVDGRDQRHLVADLEHLLDIQRRKAPEARSPVVKGVQALSKVAQDGFNIDRLGIHWGQGQPANGRVQATAPKPWALTKKTICNPSHCVIRRRTLQRF